MKRCMYIPSIGVNWQGGIIEYCLWAGSIRFIPDLGFTIRKLSGWFMYSWCVCRRKSLFRLLTGLNCCWPVCLYRIVRSIYLIWLIDCLELGSWPPVEQLLQHVRLVCRICSTFNINNSLRHLSDSWLIPTLKTATTTDAGNGNDKRLVYMP